MPSKLARFHRLPEILDVLHYMGSHFLYSGSSCIKRLEGGGEKY